jgi:hypothetical protein
LDTRCAQFPGHWIINDELVREWAEMVKLFVVFNGPTSRHVWWVGNLLWFDLKLTCFFFSFILPVNRIQIQDVVNKFFFPESHRPSSTKSLGIVVETIGRIDLVWKWRNRTRSVWLFFFLSLHVAQSIEHTIDLAIVCFLEGHIWAVFSFLNNQTKLLSAVDRILFVLLFVCVHTFVLCVLSTPFSRFSFQVYLFIGIFFLSPPLFLRVGLGGCVGSCVFHINGPTEVSRRRGK